MDIGTCGLRRSTRSSGDCAKGRNHVLMKVTAVLANAIHLELSDQRHQPLRSSSSDPNVVVVSDK